ncbi:hypothetical protein GCM10017557_54220 [Streptomyces aurantiacus]|uniref:Transposase n=1 Tax=Streptomyces aurantiacus TaxID=47760 RepID=A0A7G1P441_9ACTN|nr:hypothetical protein GCM10017557_54220 [Streptomyces aurantiacus]
MTSLLVRWFRVIRSGREALRCLLARRGIAVRRTRTGKESPDPERDAELDRIEHVLDHFPDRVFAFDEFGALGIRPHRRLVLGRGKVLAPRDVCPDTGLVRLSYGQARVPLDEHTALGDRSGTGWGLHPLLPRGLRGAGLRPPRACGTAMC